MNIEIPEGAGSTLFIHARSREDALSIMDQFPDADWAYSDLYEGDPERSPVAMRKMKMHFPEGGYLEINLFPRKNGRA